MPEFYDPPKVKVQNGIPGLNTSSAGKLAAPRPPLELKPPTPPKAVPKRPLNIPNPKPDLPNIKPPKRKPSGGRVRGGGFVAAKGGKAAGKKLGLKGLGAKALPVIGYASLFYDVVGVAEDLAPGVQHWLTGGWKGTTPGGSFAEAIQGQCEGVLYKVNVIYQHRFHGERSTGWDPVGGPIAGVAITPGQVVSGFQQYTATLYFPDGSSLPSHNLGPLTSADAYEVRYDRKDGLPDDCAFREVSAPHPMTENPTLTDTLPPVEVSPLPDIASPSLPSPSPSTSPGKRPSINLSPPGDLAPSSNPTGPDQQPATPEQPAQPDPDEETPPRPTPTGDSCSLDPCQAAQGNQLDSIKDDTEHIDDIRDRLENLLDYAQDAFRHEQIMGKLEMICDELKKDEEQEQEQPELEAVELAYCDCNDKNPEIKFFEFSVPTDSISESTKQLFLDSAQKAFLQCSEPELFVLAPEKYSLKPINPAPQLNITFRHRGSTGKWDKDGYRITIPHYNGPRAKRPNLPDYTRGPILCTQRLSDGTQINFYCKSETEGKKVLRALLKYVPDNLVSNDRPETYVKTRSTTPVEKVVFYNACFYENGDTSKAPDWKVWYKNRGKSQP